MHQRNPINRIDTLNERINAYELAKLTQSRHLILDADELQGPAKEYFESFWIDLFIAEFLSEDAMHDDLLFFVRHLSSTKLATDKQVKTDRSQTELPEQIELFRKDSKRMPIGDQDIDWRRTVYLNYILQNFTYTITCAISKIDNEQMQVIRKHTVEVFASPSARHMSLNKADDERITYPDIYFAVDRYEEFLNEISITSGHIVCIELVAINKKTGIKSSLFLGSINHAIMSNAIKSARFMLGCTMLQSQSNTSETEFILVRGPGSLGKAEIAIIESRQNDGSQYQTGLRKFVEGDSYELIELDPNEIQVIPEIGKLNPLSSSMHSFCFPMIKKARKALKHRRSMSEGTLTIDRDNIANFTTTCKNLSSFDERPLTSEQSDSLTKLSSKDTRKGDFMMLENLRNALEFCRPKAPKQSTCQMIINAYITNINMNWSDIIDELKISRAPIFKL